MDEKKITAEEEHEKDVEDTTNTLTVEDLVEQAVYAANAPSCCSETERSENMLGMLGANVVDNEIYHDEEECPSLKMN